MLLKVEKKEVYYPAGASSKLLTGDDDERDFNISSKFNYDTSGGIPAGLEVTNEVLDDLRDAGRFDLWERNGREVILYWRDFAPEAVVQLNVDLIGRIPGVTRGPASRIWLYYTPTAKHWTEPLTVEVTPAR